MTPVAIGDIQRTQGTLKTVYKAKNRLRHLFCVYINLNIQSLSEIKQSSRCLKINSMNIELINYESNNREPPSSSPQKLKFP